VFASGEWASIPFVIVGLFRSFDGVTLIRGQTSLSRFRGSLKLADDLT